MMIFRKKEYIMRPYLFLEINLPEEKETKNKIIWSLYI